MKKYRAYLSIGYPSASREEDFEFDDDASIEDIEEEIKYWRNNYLDWGYYEVVREDD